MDSATRDLFVRGVAAAKAGETAEARHYFEWLLRLDPPVQEKIDSYFWLSEMEPNPDKALAYVKEILLLDASEPRARRKLALANGTLNPEQIIDANRFSQSATSVQEGSASRFVCSNCSGKLTYHPEVQSLVCDSCQVVTHQKTSLPRQGQDLPEDSFIATLATAKGHVQPITTRVINCQGCGATFLVSPGVISRECPYCFSTYVLDFKDEEHVILPNGIVPFQIPLKQAHKAFTDWLENHLDMDHVGLLLPMVGMYVPVWTFDILGNITWTASDDDYQQEQKLKGEKQVYYDDYLMPGIIKIPSALDAALRGFDLKNLVPFDESYIVDWPAEIFKIPLADASLRVRAEILAKERGMIERSLNQRVRNMALNSTKMYIDAFRLVLLPVWMSEYQIKHTGYKVSINGQNGCVYGGLPNSARKSWISEFLGI